MGDIRYRPIGVVRSPFLPDGSEPLKRIDARGTVSTVEVFPEFMMGLRDLDGFSHIILLCHLHLSEEYALEVTPPSDTASHGVFATRSPRRPNPISLTVVRLGEVDGNFLHVHELDLFDGTPVLDIKPYMPLSLDDKAIRTGWWEETQR